MKVRAMHKGKNGVKGKSQNNQQVEAKPRHHFEKSVPQVIIANK